MIYPPNQKPSIWSIDPGIIAYNCRKYGMPCPVLAIPMWEGAGDQARDYSGHGGHAQFYNEAYWTAEGVRVDGTNDYLQIPHSDSIDFADEDFAISMRFNTTTAAALTYIFSKSYGGVGVAWYGVNIDTENHRITCFVDDGTNNSAAQTTDDFNDGEWHDLVFVRDTTANKVIVYIDGAWNAEVVDGCGSIANTGNLVIGGRSDLNADRFFLGGFKLFTEYDTVPTAQQVKFMYENPYFMYQMPEELYGYVTGAPPEDSSMGVVFDSTIYPSNQKPPIWSIDPGIIAYNCQKYSMPFPVLAMPMWERAGDLTRDYSGHGIYGSINGSPTWGNGLNFVGNEADYVELEDMQKWTKAVTDFSIVTGTTWGAESGDATVIDFSNSVGSYWYENAIILYRRNNYVSFFISVNSTIKRVESTAYTAVTGGHSKLVATFGNSEMRLYIDGAEVPNSPTSSGATTSDGLIQPPWIGKSHAAATAQKPHKGNIKYLYFYNVCLSAVQSRFISDNPWFMYQMPEELYGYVTGAPPVGAIINQLQYFNLGADLFNGTLI